MKHEKETSSSILVQHLSFADMLMGIYLLIVMGGDQYYRWDEVILALDSRISNIDRRKLDWIDPTLFIEERQFYQCLWSSLIEVFNFSETNTSNTLMCGESMPCVSWQGSCTYWERRCQFLRLRSSPLTGCTQWYVLFHTDSNSNVTPPQTTLSWVLCIVVVTALLKLVFTNSWFFFLQPVISVHVETKLLLTARNLILISWFCLSNAHELVQQLLCFANTLCTLHLPLCRYHGVRLGVWLWEEREVTLH